ncbi:cobalamin biosynthesis protein CbiX [Halobacteriales archaeon QS_4_62_28]|nr:MAG: cobalamin biosynthesis protein CbiX [Halobacteriales archaeon QS_4_62_28]
MQRDTLLIVGRGTGRARASFETHAERLRNRSVAGTIETATYEHEPGRELRDTLAGIDTEQTYVVPMCLAHSRTTIDAIPSALDRIDGTVTYCEPIGRNPVMTRAILDRARSATADPANAGIALVGFGSSGTPYHQQAARYHAERIERQSDFADVTTCFLLQNPTVECVRYTVDAERTVAVPLFFAPSSATETEIPQKLELSRGGIDYATPLSTHEHVTDAIEVEVEKQRAIETTATGPHSFEATLTGQRRALATDGEGPIR